MKKHRENVMGKVRCGLDQLEFRQREFASSHSDYAEFVRLLAEGHRASLSFNKGKPKDVFTLALESYQHHL
jgi:hypothetical protein